MVQVTFYSKQRVDDIHTAITDPSNQPDGYTLQTLGGSLEYVPDHDPFVHEQTVPLSTWVIPQSSTLLTHHAWKTNNATALAVAFDIVSLYFETDS